MASTTKRDVARLLRQRRGVLLDLGCGNNKQAGAIGVDIRPLPSVDIVCDLFRPPWRVLPTSCAHTVVLSHVFEHVPPPIALAFMAELHRVCMDGASCFLSGPYGLGPRFVQDPTHCRPVNEATFAYWDPQHPSGLWHVYEPPPFTLSHFEVVPAGSDRDFQAILLCRKPAAAAGRRSATAPRRTRPSSKRR